MPQIRIRITGSEASSRAIRELLQSLPGIEHVEEIADLMTHMDDEDSSSAGLSENEQSPGMHVIEVEAPDDAAVQRVRETVEALAFDLDVLAEFESREANEAE